jgi:hypothetical protein
MTDRGGPVTAMIALDRPALPKQKPLVTELRRRLEDNSLAGDLQKSGDVMSFDLGDDVASIALVPTAIPWNDLEGPCITAWWWPEACEKLRPHASHLVVRLTGGSGTALERFILLTHLTAAVTSAVDAAGVYWPAGSVVHQPKMFQEYSEGLSPADVVPQLWFDMQIVAHDDGSFGFFTTGLQPLGLLEIEIDRSDREPEDILDFCQDIISYLVTSGETINAGETLGRTEGEEIEVSHGESSYGRGIVMKLGY